MEREVVGEREEERDRKRRREGGREMRKEYRERLYLLYKLRVRAP